MNSQLNEMKQRDMQGDALSVPIHAAVSYETLELLSSMFSCLGVRVTSSG